MSLDWTRAQAQGETIRIGTIYDLSGPFAAGGSMACSVGTDIAIDLVNEKGGVGGKYKVVAVKADSQSKADVAINEVERLIGQEKVDIINGVYASAHAVPLAAKIEQQKKILWITTAVSTAVFKDKNLHYVFRAQIHSDQYGQAFAGFLAEHAKGKLGMDPKDVKIAIIHEDGPYGVGVGAADESYSKQAGLQVVMKEGYSAAAPDLSSLVTKIKRSGAEVISHAGYNPDITLFLRQARENGLRFKMLFGAGAGYSQLDKLRQTFGKDIDNFCNIDPVPAQLLDPTKLAPGLGDLIKVMVERYKAKTGATEVPPHCSMGFNQTWVLLNNVLPVAKEKYGGFDPEAIRKAALDVDIPPGGTIQGYGVKFFPPDTPMSGQNERSTPVVMQNAGEHITVVWPTNIRTQDPVFPLPKSSIYAAS
jgi:branched-chain amino acid transport system substrate-binding protein